MLYIGQSGGDHWVDSSPTCVQLNTALRNSLKLTLGASNRDRSQKL